MTRKTKKDYVLTTSGYEYDKELARVSIKVVPALQALINNQHDLLKALLPNFPEMKIFLKNHMAELSVVEETIASAHAKYNLKKEETKILRQKKEDGNTSKDIASSGYDEHIKDNGQLMDEQVRKISPGLPSAKFDTAKKNPGRNEILDVRRIAIGASIKALTNVLGRKLSEDEILAIEQQVDAYL
ncbi:MAG TPA: hypothetical protein DCK76_03665 [Desulfotomaculum sp.]|nr:MAG: hypothetical protein XD84_0676 [Desulfotomaculum sp. 46_80]HAG10486.1 hypothetical protein [Desulfotomaculum sp.]HBY04091.1 hypothetical protein [Desulfotomaculum sp.]